MSPKDQREVVNANEALPSSLQPAGSGPDDARSSFLDVATAVKEALSIVNAGITAHGGSINSGSPESESEPLSPEIPVLGPPIVNLAIHDDDSTSVSAPTDTDQWLNSASAGASLRFPDMTESTAVYHIGTPTLYPASSNPSGSSSGVYGAQVCPVRDESGKIGRMAPLKPIVGGGPRNQSVSVSQVLKMIVLGDASVGKTAIIQRFVNGAFQVLPYKPTVGADFYSQKLEYTSKDSGETMYITLQIWDTAGQERYKSLASSFYRGADICVIVDDCTRPNSLATVGQWHQDFLRHAVPIEPETFPFIFLLNKSDLVSGSDAISTEAVWRQQVSGKFKVPPSRSAIVSAKTGNNIEEVLFLAAKLGAQRAIRATDQIRRQQQHHGRVVNLDHNTENGDDSIFNCLSQC